MYVFIFVIFASAGLVRSDCPDNDAFPCGRLCWCVPGCGGKDYCPQIGQSCVNGAFQDCAGGCVMPNDRTSACDGSPPPPYPDIPVAPPVGMPIGMPVGMPTAPPIGQPTGQPRSPPANMTMPPPASSRGGASSTDTAGHPSSDPPWWKTIYAKVGAAVAVGVLFLLVAWCLLRRDAAPPKQQMPPWNGFSRMQGTYSVGSRPSFL